MLFVLFLEANWFNYDHFSKVGKLYKNAPGTERVNLVHLFVKFEVSSYSAFPHYSRFSFGIFPKIPPCS